MHAYSGSVHSPYPPMPGGWAAVGHGDALAAERAVQLSQYRDAAGMPMLPAWHYHDELLRTGLYRFFAFVAPDGAQGVSCCRFVGEDAHPATLGALSDPTAGGDSTAGDSGTGGAGKSDTGGTLPSGDTIQCDAPQVPNAAGTACVTPSGGGGGTPTPQPQPKPAPAPGGQPGVVQAGSSGPLLALLAALAVGGTIVAASAAKHPVRAGKKKPHRRT